MAFDITDKALGYGDGSKGDWTPTAGDYVINAYARVTALTKTTLTIADATTSSYSGFTVGTEVLFHIVNVATTNLRHKIGLWRVCKITAVNGNVLTVTNTPTTIIKDAFANCTAQVVTVPNYKNVTLNEGVNLKPTPYTGGKGGIVALKCSGTLTLNGGHIDLRNAGLTAARILLQQELEEQSHYGRDSLNKHSCWENYCAEKHFTLNYGDGATWIVCKNINAIAASRIGNPSTQGVRYQRGESRDNVWAKSPVGVLSGLTKDGGSTILICAKTIKSLPIQTLAKYRTGSEDQTRGFARCYIASDTPRRADEALSAYDVISTPSRLQDTFNIKDFGDGTEGVGTNVTVALNNFARITAISNDRSILTIAAKTTNGVARWKVGALVMVHPIHKGSNVKYSGRFHIAKIVGINGTKITIDTPIPDLSGYSLANYNFQLVTIPQYTSFTLSGENKATTAYDNTKLRGGILAIACSGTCDIRGAKLNVENKGGGSAYGSAGLAYISNGGMATRLPLGQGHGSVFILAKALIMDENTRIGATYAGNAYGGSTPAKLPASDYGYIGAHYTGAYQEYGSTDIWADTATEKSSVDVDLCGTQGWGGGAGTSANKHGGGYGSNAEDGTPQGAHVMIVADKITGFNITAISTGGQTATTRKGKNHGTATPLHKHGGAGYGGGGVYSVVSKNTKNGAVYSTLAYGGTGGFIGGGSGSGDETNFGHGGSSSGFCFVYCNEVENQNTKDTSIN
ncbi:MAG: hypothetical protein IJK81_11500 [Selenomonadaceae bacterium]|nr:hypothetical protein [Selenomonadaceae bacterium]